MKMFLVFQEWNNVNIALFFDRMEAVKYALRFDGLGIQSVDVEGEISSVPFTEDLAFPNSGFFVE